MKPVYQIYQTAITPLGRGLRENLQAIHAGCSGIAYTEGYQNYLSAYPVSRIPDSFFSPNCSAHMTRFDALLFTICELLKTESPIPLDTPDVLIILSTTKGNVELLESPGESKAFTLPASAEWLCELLGNPNKPVVVSQACISGVSAHILAHRWLCTGKFKHVVIFGCDVLTQFVSSGFNSFHALSKEPCKPFDAQRKGINLGEAGAITILSSEETGEIQIGAGFISNDSNHISGPSKSGEELAWCIQKTLEANALVSDQIACVSAHGTATAYNDEMESKAFELSGLNGAPVFSLKGAYGHTLGASGVLEIALCAGFICEEWIPSSIHFEEKGVSGNILISEKVVHQPVPYILKTASGFGGCNAAILIQKASTSPG